jgi:hypothetical protein
MAMHTPNKTVAATPLTTEAKGEDDGVFTDAVSTDERPSLPTTVREKCDLTCPLDRDGHLPLMAPARTGGAAGPDLAPLRHEAAKSTKVFVIDFLYALFAEKAVLAAARAGSGPGAPGLLLRICHFLDSLALLRGD